MTDTTTILPTFDELLTAAPATPAPEDAPLPTFDQLLDRPSATETLLGAPRARSVEERFIDAIPSVSKAISDSVGQLFEAPIGLADETLAPFVAKTPEEAEGLPGLIRTFNKTVLGTAGAALDVTLRATLAPIIGGISAVGQVAREVGMSDTWARRLERDLLALSVATGVASGTPASTPRNLATFREAARERVAVATEGVPPAARVEAGTKMADALDTGIKVGKREMGDADALPPLTEPRLTQPLHKDVVAAAEELLTEGGVARAEGRLLSDQVMELLQTKRLTTERIGAILDKHNLTPDAFAEMWRVNIRKAAQDMQALSAVEQRLKALKREAGAEADLAAWQEAQGIGQAERGLNWWRRVDNVRRGLLVTQLSTAMRNLETQVGRVGLDVLQRGMDDVLRQTFAPGAPRRGNAADAFGSALNIFWRPRETKAQVDRILAAFPKENDRLFGNWMSEFQTGAFGKAENAVRLLNTANRFQEFVIRRAVLRARLAEEMSARGKSLDDVMARNAIGEIPKEAMERAVSDALEMTWSKGFSPFAKGPEGLAGAFIKIVNEMPGATLAIPFPRFLMNAVKFQYEWSPLGYLRLLSPSQRQAIAAGDMSAISRATIGTGLLLAAKQFRDSEFAGERWYEAKLADGRVIDLRPFNPFASYLFVADIVKRRNEGTLNRLTGGDIANGILSTQMRAGTGAYILDSLLNGLAGLDVGEKGERAIKELAGNWLAGFAVPLNMVGDFLAEFDESSRTIRSGREGPNVGPVSLGPLQRNIPVLKENLPPLYSPLAEGPIRREAPLLRQTTGIGLRSPKNPVEAEVDRLGITRREYFSSTGDPSADRMMAAEMGPLVERGITPLVTSAEYKALDPAVQAYVLIKALQTTRSTAKSIVARKEPQLAARLKIEGFSARQRAAFDALTGGRITQALALLQGETPEGP